MDCRANLLEEDLGLDRARLLSRGLAQAVLAPWGCLEAELDGWEYLVRRAALIEGQLGRLD